MYARNHWIDFINTITDSQNLNSKAKELCSPVWDASSYLNDDLITIFTW